jgi:hypothetical protein
MHCWIAWLKQVVHAWVVNYVQKSVLMRLLAL